MIIEGVMEFKPDVDNVNVSTLQFDNKNIKAISEQEITGMPAFNKLDEVRFGLKTQSNLAQPVVFKDEELLFIIQCESRIIKKINKHTGFHQADEQILKILCSYLAMQIEKMQSKKEANKREQAVIDTLELTSEICTQRNYSGLFRKMCEFMPNYFGFEAVGALILDKESK